MATNIISIYKIEKNKIDIERYYRSQDTLREKSIDYANLEDYTSAIVHQHNQEVNEGESFAKKYVPTETGSAQEMGGVKFITYHSEDDSSESHAWDRLFARPLSLRRTVYENVASFFEIDGELFAINAGHGIGLFARYIDDVFPIQVAQRIMHPNPTSANERIVAGNILGRTQNFRRRQVISAARNINSVWQELGGKLTENTINDKEFQEIFPRRAKEVNAEFAGYILIRKSLDFANIPRYAKWLLAKEAQELTEDQKRSFDYLMCLERVSRARSKDLLKRLNAAYAGYILNQASDTVDTIDFTHREYSKLIAANTFQVSGLGGNPINIQGEDVFGQSNPAEYMIGVLREYVSRVTDGEQLDDEGSLEILKDIRISTGTGDIINNLSAPALYYFQGEFNFEDVKYFRIDSEWYLASASFMKVVNNEFKTLVEQDYFTDISDIMTLPSKQGVTDENEYNQGYNTQDGCIVADKVEIDNIELADVIRFSRGKIYIYHNKYKFGASIRDVCSQLSLSMSMISRIIDSKESGREILNEYYTRLETKYTTGEYRHMNLGITRNAFIDTIVQASASDFTFILGCIDDLAITPDRQSSIAKFEAISITKVESSGYGFKLRIVRIASEEK